MVVRAAVSMDPEAETLRSAIESQGITRQYKDVGHGSQQRVDLLFRAVESHISILALVMHDIDQHPSNLEFVAFLVLAEMSN